MMAVAQSLSILEVAVDECHHHLGLDFSLRQVINEEHKPSQIYAVRFCDVLPSYWSYFATVGGNCASVYEVGRNKTVDFIQAYVDSGYQHYLQF